MHNHPSAMIGCFTPSSILQKNLGYDTDLDKVTTASN